MSYKKNSTKLISTLLILIFLISCSKRSDYQNGNEFFKVKNYEKALGYYQRALPVITEADREIIYRKMGLTHNNLGNKKEASHFLYKTLKMNPDQPKIAMIAANIFLDLKKYNEAISTIRKIPDSKEKFLIISKAYLSLGNAHDAITFLEKAIKITEDKGSKVAIKYDFAKKLLRHPNFCKEKNRFFEELEVNFKSKKSKIEKEFYKYFYIALNCDKKNTKITKKIEVLNRLIDKKDTYYQNKLIEIYLIDRKFDKALPLLVESQKIDSKKIELLYLNSLYSYYKGKFNSSTSFMKNYLKAGGNNPKALKILANSQLYSEQYEDAIENYKKLIKKDKLDIDSFLSIKECYEKTKNSKELEKINYELKKWDKRTYR